MHTPWRRAGTPCLRLRAARLGQASWKKETNYATIPPPHHGVVILPPGRRQPRVIGTQTGPKRSLTPGMPSSSTKPTSSLASLRSGAWSRLFKSSVTMDLLPKRLKRALGDLMEVSSASSRDQYSNEIDVKPDMKRFLAIRQTSASLCLLSVTGRPSFWRPLPRLEYQRLRTLRKWNQGGQRHHHGCSTHRYRNATRTEICQQS